MEKRSYQEEDKKIIREALESEGSMMYQLATGGGKSVVATMLAKEWDSENKRTLVIAHRERLISQMFNHFDRNGIKVGKIIANIEENLDANIIVASVWTIVHEKRFNQIIGNGFDCVIIDEAHRTASNTYEKILGRIRHNNPSAKILGLSATPERKDGKPLDTYFNYLHSSKDTRWLINNGFLSKYKVWHMPIGELKEQVERSGSDYKISELSKYMRTPERIKHAVESYRKHANGKSCLLYAVDRNHGKNLKEEFIKEGFENIEYIDAETPQKEREDILERYVETDNMLLISIETMTEGVDLPNTQCVQLERPTLSLTLYLQMVGRGLRPSENKDECLILDNAGCVHEHGMPDKEREWDLSKKIDRQKSDDETKIIGKKKDGSLTSDWEDIEDIELVEITREEYLGFVMENLEEAEKHNENLRRKKEDFEQEKYSKLIEILGECGCKEISANYGTVSMSYKNVSLETDLKKDGFVLINRGWGNNRINHSKENFSQYIELCQKFLEKDKDNQSLEHYNKIKDKIKSLKEEEVDLTELREKQKEIKREALFVKLDSHLSEGQNVFKVLDEKRVFTSDLFSHLSWYDRREVKTAIFVKDRVLNNNPISFFDNHGCEVYTSKSVKKDKVYEIFSRGIWYNEETQETI